MIDNKESYNENFKEFLGARIKEAEKEREETILLYQNRVKEEGLTNEIILMAYCGLNKPHPEELASLIITDKDEVNYSANVYKINSVISENNREIVTHFNNLKQPLKKFYQGPLNDKWEDEDLPEETYSIHCDYNKLVEHSKALVENSKALSESTGLDVDYDVLSEVSEYFDYYVVTPAFIYDYQARMVETKGFKNKSELLDFCYKLKETSEKTFLYSVVLLKKGLGYKLRFCFI
jgi:hypothetical protein